MLKILLTLASLLYLVNFVTGVLKPNSKLYIVDGEGFSVYLDVLQSFGAIQNCWFRFESEQKVRLELNSTIPITTDRGESILPFSEKVCGIRVSKINNSSAASWTLEAENLFGDLETGTVQIETLPSDNSNFETVVYREMGAGTIACSKNEQYTKRCKIIEDNGDSWDTCELLTTIKPNRTFDCLMFNWGQVGPNHERIIVNMKNSSANANASVEETETSYILRCRFDFSPFSCQAETPERKNEFYIMEGLYNGKYSTYDTSTSQSVCAFEIPKPLSPNEIGLWRIKNYESSTPSGCLFYIGKSKGDIIETELEQMKKIKSIKVYRPDSDKESLPEITCLLPFIIDDCYIKAPNNSVYFPNSIQFQRQRLYGKCSFTNLPILSGIWTCGARSHDYSKEILQDVEVSVKRKSGEILSTAMKMKKGRDVELMCRSPFDEPIKNCLFIDPKNRVHLVGTENSIKTGGHVQYYGRGLHMGDCGVQVIDITAEDFGEWTCQFLVLSNRDASTFKVQLSETAASQATTIGLGVGITTIIILVGGVALGTVVYKNRQKSAQLSFSSNNPNDLNAAEQPGTINLTTN